jgi:hypothetical protein
MPRPKQLSYKLTLKRTSYLAPALAFVIIILAAGPGYGQANPSTFTFRSGQSVYIVAFRIIQFPLVVDDVQVDPQREYINYDLDAERKSGKGSRSGSSSKFPKN